MFQQLLFVGQLLLVLFILFVLQLIAAMTTRSLTLQWHVTDRCNHRCLHCYMFDESTWSAGATREMPLDQCQEVIDQFLALCRALSAQTNVTFEPHFVLSGGDPLLHRDFWELLRLISCVARGTKILGNADQLDAQALARMAEYGVESYQISLDGLEVHHDGLRGPGSFARSLRGLELVRQAGLASLVMTTVVRENMCDIPRLMELVAEQKVSSFAFARAASYGNARDLDVMIQPHEYRELLLAARDKELTLAAGGATTHFVHKDHLWKLLLYELGEYRLYPHLNPGKIVDGCHLGQSFLVLLADGTAMACRRFFSPVGRFPEQSLSDIFLRSLSMARYRRVAGLSKCQSCELLHNCRGCPAVAHGSSGDWQAPDPQCWSAC
jgi:radical SAM/SPASM domain protein of ACGX system